MITACLTSVFQSSNGVTKWSSMVYKVIHFISNYHGTEITEVKRTQKDGSKKIVPCPQVVKNYIAFMGGVDLADRYQVLYGTNRKKKCRLFFSLLDIAFVNAFVIFCELQQKIPVFEFRRLVVQGLLVRAANSRTQKVTKRSLDFEPGPSKNMT